MFDSMSGKNRAILALAILFILIVIIPVAQENYLINSIPVVSIEEDGNGEVLSIEEDGNREYKIVVKDPQKSTKTFLITFIVNFFIIIADGLLITAIVTRLLTEVFSIDKTDPRTGVKPSKRGKVAVFVGAITFFGLYVEFKDIYFAGFEMIRLFKMTGSFENIFDAFSKGL